MLRHRRDQGSNKASWHASSPQNASPAFQIKQGEPKDANNAQNAASSAKGQKNENANENKSKQTQPSSKANGNKGTNGNNNNNQSKYNNNNNNAKSKAKGAPSSTKAQSQNKGKPTSSSDKFSYSQSVISSLGPTSSAAANAPTANLHGGSASNSNSLSGGAIAGIVVGCVVALALVAAVAWLLSRWRTKSQKKAVAAAAAVPPPPPPMQQMEYDPSQQYATFPSQPSFGSTYQYDAYQQPMPMQAGTTYMGHQMMPISVSGVSSGMPAVPVVANSSMTAATPAEAAPGNMAQQQQPSAMTHTNITALGPITPGDTITSKGVTKKKTRSKSSSRRQPAPAEDPRATEGTLEPDTSFYSSVDGSDKASEIYEAYAPYEDNWLEVPPVRRERRRHRRRHHQRAEQQGTVASMTGDTSYSNGDEDLSHSDGVSYLDQKSDLQESFLPYTRATEPTQPTYVYDPSNIDEDAALAAERLRNNARYAAQQR
ncbi:hypothetical protein ACI68E_001451 [Malassezia pachydermatis]